MPHIMNRNGVRFHVTLSQWELLRQLYQQDRDGAADFYEFRARALPRNGKLLMEWCGKWMTIAEDGGTE